MTTHHTPAMTEGVEDTLWIETRAAALALINANALMRHSGVLTDDQLSEWLEGAVVHQHPDPFNGFTVLFGFDRYGQDFIVVKGIDFHFAIAAGEQK